MYTEIRLIQVADAEAFRACLDGVARERRFLAQVEALPLEKVRSFVEQSVLEDAAQFVAIEAGLVVGWCDIFAQWPYALRHCGTLGMGVSVSHRGRGVGERLLRATLDKAAVNGITRVVLEAREDNVNAIKLYQKLGFKLEAVKERALRFEGKYFRAVQMSLLQGEA